MSAVLVGERWWFQQALRDADPPHKDILLTLRRHGSKPLLRDNTRVLSMSFDGPSLEMVLLGEPRLGPVVYPLTRCRPHRLYRGMVPPLLGVTPIFAVSFWVYLIPHFHI